jgi:hypothetical protein
MPILLHVAAAGAFYCLLAGLDYSNRTRISAVLLFAILLFPSTFVPWHADPATGLTLASLACFAHGQRAISVAAAAATMYLSAGSAVVAPSVVAMLAFLYCSQARRRAEVGLAVAPYLPFAAASLVWHAPYALPQRTPALAIGLIIAALWILAAMNFASIREDLMLCGALTLVPLAMENPYLAATGMCLLISILFVRLSQFLHLGHPPRNQ